MDALGFTFYKNSRCTGRTFCLDQILQPRWAFTEKIRFILIRFDFDHY